MMNQLRGAKKTVGSVRFTGLITGLIITASVASTGAVLDTCVNVARAATSESGEDTAIITGAASAGWVVPFADAPDIASERSKPTVSAIMTPPESARLFPPLEHKS